MEIIHKTAPSGRTFDLRIPFPLEIVRPSFLSKSSVPLPASYSAATSNRHSSRPPLNLLSSICLTAAVLSIAFIATAQAQEIPRPSLSRTRDGAPNLTRPYNLKLGPIALSASAGMGFEFVDNVNLTEEEKVSDVIFRPSLSIQGVWQVTKLNNLELRTGFAYTKYLNNPALDSQSALISPDSEIRLNIFVGDVKIIFHEQFSFEEDPTPDGDLSGVAKFGRFTNTIGVTALWDLNDVIWSLGYSHYNFITTGDATTTEGSSNSDLSSLDHSTDQVSTAVALKFGPTTAVGIEGTAAYSIYPNNSNGNYSSFSLGPYVDMQLTRYTHFTLGAGYQIYSSEGDTDSVPPPQFVATPGVDGVITTSTVQNSNRQINGDGNGYYVNLSIVHRLNSNYMDRLSVGREFQIGLLSDRSETTFIRYSSVWAFSRRLSLTTSLAYESVRQRSQISTDAVLSDYQYFSGALSTSFQISKKANVSLAYQHAQRISDVVGQDYSQNRLAIQFGYQF